MIREMKDPRQDKDAEVRCKETMNDLKQAASDL